MNVYRTRLVISMQHAPTQKDLLSVCVILDTLEMGIHVKVSQTSLLEEKNNDLFLFALSTSEGGVFMRPLTRLVYVTQIFLFEKGLFSITEKMTTTNINRIISLDNLP